MNVVYARYNRHRLPPFQTETSIVESHGEKTVVKKALTPGAVDHIKAIRAGYDLIQRHLVAGSLVLPRLLGFDGSSISMQYIEGESFDRLLFQSFRGNDKASFLRIIDDYRDLLKKAFRRAERPEFTRLRQNTPCLPPATLCARPQHFAQRPACNAVHSTAGRCGQVALRAGGTGMNGEPTAATRRGEALRRSLESCETGRSRASGSAAVPFGFTTDAPRLPALPIGSAETRAAGNFTAKASEIFGVNAASQLDNGEGWLPVAAVDTVFENIIVSGKAYYLIDNEWVFAGGVPVAFVVFRSLFYFHQVKYFELGMEKWLPFAELLAHCRISPELADHYRRMDEMFQAYVYGPERCFKYKEQYKKRAIAVHALEQTIEHQRAVVRKYHAAILQNERVISDIVNSFGWRLWQKIARGINFLCPAGSLRRRFANRLLAFLKARDT